MAKRKRVMRLRSEVPAHKHQPCNVDGEACMIALKRFENDKALRGRIWNSCCDCGLEHLYVYEVFPDPTRRSVWWLNKRAYRNPTKRKVQ